VGATHIAVLMTRRRSELERPSGGLRARLEAFALSRVYGKAVASSYRGRGRSINKVVTEVLDGSIGNLVRVSAIVMPDSSVEIDRLTIDRGKLMEAFEGARAATANFLG
jgi:hypothetical protein